MNSRHNSVKSKVLITLYDRKYYYKDNTGISRIELAKTVGSTDNYLRLVLPRWVRWRYVTKLANNGKDSAHFVYRITQRGCRFIEERLMPEQVMAYRQELRDLQG